MNADMKHNPAAALRPVEPGQAGGFKAVAQVEGVYRSDLGQLRPECLHRAVKAEGMSDHCPHTAGGYCAGNALGGSEARREWLLDQYGLPRVACRVHDLGVELRRHRHDHGFHIRVSHEIVVIIVKSAAVHRSDLRPFGVASPADGDESRVRQVVYDMAGVARPVLTKADQPDAEHGSGVLGAIVSIECGRESRSGATFTT